MSGSVRVFVNGVGLDAPEHGTALDAVTQFEAATGRAVTDGTLSITDSRGLPIPPHTAMYNGAVLRLIPNRQRDSADPAAQFDE